jgi:hypothetical protein
MSGSSGSEEPSIEDIELEKRRPQMDKDVAHLVDHYIKIVEWDVPESDLARVRGAIIAEIRLALDRIESQT